MSEVKYLKGVKKCLSQGKIYNRHSGRCVAPNGRIGKAILAKDNAPVFLPVKLIKTLNLSPKKSPVRVSSPKKSRKSKRVSFRSVSSPKKSPVRVSSPKKSPARVSSPKKSRKSKRVAKTFVEKALECKKAGKMINPKTGRCINITKKNIAKLGDTEYDQERLRRAFVARITDI